MSPTNRHETWIVEEYWNFTPNGMARLTDFVTIADSIKLFQCLYGEENDIGSILLPMNFGTENPFLIGQFFDVARLSISQRLDLGLQVHREPVP